MSASLRRMAGIACAAALTLSTARGASIECSKLNLMYDELLKDSEERLRAAVAEGMAMPEQQRNTVRPKICAISGEIVGYYKLIQLLATDCSKRGEDMRQLLEEIKDYLGAGNEELRKHCAIRGNK